MSKEKRKSPEILRRDLATAKYALQVVMDRVREVEGMSDDKQRILEICEGAIKEINNGN